MQTNSSDNDAVIATAAAATSPSAPAPPTSTAADPDSGTTKPTPITTTTTTTTSSTSQSLGRVAQDFDLLGVIDVEATCDEGSDSWGPSEIIEFPCVVLDTKTLQIVKEIQLYVKPVEKPVLTKFCTELTGIEQSTVDKAQPLQETLSQFHTWLESNGFLKSATELKAMAFCCDGPWDMNHFLHNECKRKNIDKPLYFNQWVNIRWLFAEFFSTRRTGVTNMLNHLNLSFHGQTHSGLWDARNIARIASKMIESGCNMKINDGVSDELSVKWRVPNKAKKSSPPTSNPETRDKVSTVPTTTITPCTAPLPQVPPATSPATKSAPPSPQIQGVEYFVILDFEAICEEGPTPVPQEIIEFPSVLLNSRTLKVEDEFHVYVRPEIHPVLSKFCTSLTGITQEMVDRGVTLGDAMQMHRDWLAKHGLICLTPDTAAVHSFIFVTCGDWDLNICLPKLLGHLHVEVPPYYVKNHLNIKHGYCSVYHRPALGMKGMLKELAIELVGRHHSGIDDCRNITQILIRMINDGYTYHVKPKPGTVPQTKPAKTSKAPKEEFHPSNEQQTLLAALLAFVTLEQLQEATASVGPDPPEGKVVGMFARKCLELFLLAHGESYRALSNPAQHWLRDEMMKSCRAFISKQSKT
ncbi:exonuclease III protein [Pelomyxa schiedti]|nr:exonuclease III protein [Pelomyxa schiedti]